MRDAIPTLTITVILAFSLFAVWMSSPTGAYYGDYYVQTGPFERTIPCGGKVAGARCSFYNHPGICTIPGYTPRNVDEAIRCDSMCLCVTDEPLG